MSTEDKKFSFSFIKQLKKSNIIPSDVKVDTNTENIQLIDCVEEKSIKVIGDKNETKKFPLVIPLKKNNKIIETSKENIVAESSKTDEQSIEDIAVQELINESKNITTKPTPLVHTIPKLSENGEITGEPESTLDDYENIPISEFGFAMLRGMGWKEDQKIGNNQKSIQKMPVVRPKGMGLGADKLSADKNRLILQVTKNGDQLKIVKNAYVKIISGRYTNMLGEVQGFDDDAGSVIIKLALNGNVVSLQEFLVVPITKSEYDKNSKVINLQKYEEYGKKENTDHNKYENLDSSQYKSKTNKNISYKFYDSEENDSSNRKHQGENSKRYSNMNEKGRNNDSKSNMKNDYKYTKNKNHSNSSSDSDSEYNKNHRKNIRHRNERHDSKYQHNDIDSYRSRNSRYYEKHNRDKYNDSNSSKYSKNNRNYDDTYKHKKSTNRRSRSK